MKLVFDSNIWIGELGLKSPASSSVRYFIKLKDAQLVLPEVVRLEVEYNLNKRLNDFIKNIQKNYNQLLIVFGHLKEIVLPDSEEIGNIVKDLFNTLQVDIREVPFSFPSAKDSFLRTIKGITPSSEKNQQFKDGVLWADCVDLLEQDDVILVSNDKAFYEGTDYSNGLSSTLAKEIQDMPHDLKLFHDIGDLLKEIQEEIYIDGDLIVRLFFEKYKENINGILDKNGFVLGTRQSCLIEPFTTENLDLLFIKFTISFVCPNRSEIIQTPGILMLKGDGIYNQETEQFEQLRNLGDELNYLDEETKEQVKKKNLYGYGIGMRSGHRDIKYTFRRPIDKTED